MSTKIIPKLCLLSLGVCAAYSTAFANVRGLSSSELAHFANNAQTPNGYRQPQPVAQSLPNGNIQLNPQEQQFILNQLSRLVQNQAPAQPQGFTTVSLNKRAKPQIESANVEEEQKQTPETPDLETSKSSSGQNNDSENNWMMGVIKKMSGQQQVQTQTTAPQRRTIQAGQFGSAQVQNASFSLNNAYNMVRPSLKSAPVIGNTQFYARGPANIRCVIEAAKKHSVPPHILLGIASKERGKNGQTVKNSNDSYDLGHFQLNTIHFQPGQVFGHINLEDARWRGCYNAELAAWLLNRQLTLKSKQGEDFWTKAGGYHSWTPKYNRIYVYGTAKNKGLIHYAQEWDNWLKRNPNMMF